MISTAVGPPGPWPADQTQTRPGPAMADFAMSHPPPRRKTRHCPANSACSALGPRGTSSDYAKCHCTVGGPSRRWSRGSRFVRWPAASDVRGARAGVRLCRRSRTMRQAAAIAPRVDAGSPSAWPVESPMALRDRCQSRLICPRGGLSAARWHRNGPTCPSAALP